MKRASSAADDTLKPNNRRALLPPHSPLLSDPDVVAFLDDTKPDPQSHRQIWGKLLDAGAGALLLELIKATKMRDAYLARSNDAEVAQEAPSLDDNLFAYVAEHLGEVPWLEVLEVESSLITQAACTHLQAFLIRPGCVLRRLSFTDCHFPDPQVHFPLQSSTIEEFEWFCTNYVARADGLPQILPCLAHWSKLRVVDLFSLGNPFPYSALLRLLKANESIAALSITASRAQDPVEFFEGLKHDLTGLLELSFNVSTFDDSFHARCLELVIDCLVNNNTLQRLTLPGIEVCSHESQRTFVAGLDRNRSLISLQPLPTFSTQIPAAINSNMRRQLWFTKDFIRGAAEAFMKQMGGPSDAGHTLALQMTSTPQERSYCGALMALLCKSTQNNAVKLRSAGLRAAIHDYMHEGEQTLCLTLISDMVRLHLDLLPEDKALVVDFARAHHKETFLPAGYAPAH